MTCEAINGGRTTQINIADPTLEDMKRLVETYSHFRLLDLGDGLSPIEHPNFVIMFRSGHWL